MICVIYCITREDIVAKLSVVSKELSDAIKNLNTEELTNNAANKITVMTEETIDQLLLVKIKDTPVFQIVFDMICSLLDKDNTGAQAANILTNQIKKISSLVITKLMQDLSDTNVTVGKYTIAGDKILDILTAIVNRDPKAISDLFQELRQYAQQAIVVLVKELIPTLVNQLGSLLIESNHSFIFETERNKLLKPEYDKRVKALKESLSCMKQPFSKSKVLNNFDMILSDFNNSINKKKIDETKEKNKHYNIYIEKLKISEEQKEKLRTGNFVDLPESIISSPMIDEYKKFFEDNKDIIDQSEDLPTIAYKKYQNYCEPFSKLSEDDQKTVNNNPALIIANSTSQLDTISNAAQQVSGTVNKYFNPKTIEDFSKKLEEISEKLKESKDKNLPPSPPPTNNPNQSELIDGYIITKKGIATVFIIGVTISILFFVYKKIRNKKISL